MEWALSWPYGFQSTATTLTSTIYYPDVVWASTGTYSTVTGSYIAVPDLSSIQVVSTSDVVIYANELCDFAANYWSNAQTVVSGVLPVEHRIEIVEEEEITEDELAQEEVRLFNAPVPGDPHQGVDYGPLRAPRDQSRIPRVLSPVQMKAKSRLLRMLNLAQREQLEKDDSFELSVGANHYRIRHGRLVERFNPETNRIICRYCIHPPSEYALPGYDLALTQKLLLQTNEEEFLRIANVHSA